MDASIRENLLGADVKLKVQNEELDKLKTQIKNYDQRMDDLETKNLYLKAYSMRENIRFTNICEEENEDTEGILRAFFRDELDLYDYDSIEIQRVHRSGKIRSSKPRSILARFVRYKDVERILSKGKNLKGTEYQTVQRPATRNCGTKKKVDAHSEEGKEQQD